MGCGDDDDVSKNMKLLCVGNFMGERGGYQNSDAVREVEWYYRLVQNDDKGEGVKNTKN